MGAVTIRVVGAVVILKKVPTGDVIYIAVAVIVKTVAGNLVGGVIDVGLEIGMGDVHSAINHGNHYTGADGCVPGRGGIYLVQPPEIGGGKEGIVGDDGRLPSVVRLGIFHLGISRQGRHSALDITSNLDTIDGIQARQLANDGEFTARQACLKLRATTVIQRTS